MKNYFSAILGSLLVSSLMAAAENPYKIILERNAFRLSSPPTNTPPPVIVPPEPPPNIKFTGITALSGEKRAWFIVTGPKPGDKPDYWDLQVGQRRGTLEVLDILPNNGEVKVKSSGKEMLLSFKDHGNKPSNTPVAQPGGGSIPMPGINVQPNVNIPQPTPAGVPFQGSTIAPMGNSTIAPTRPVSTPASAVSTLPGATVSPNATVNFTAGDTVRTIPRVMRSTGGVPSPTVAPVPSQQQQVALEQQLIHHEIQREIHKNNPDFPPLPPALQ